MSDFTSKFDKTESAEQDRLFVEATVGLKTRDEYAQARAAHEAQTAPATARAPTDDASKPEKKRSRPTQILSFAEGDDEEEDEPVKCKSLAPKRVRADPNAEASAALADPDRERAELERKERLKAEWLLEQARFAKEKIEITYSFWTGTGSRRVTTIQKGATIGEFLETARRELVVDFPQLRNQSSDMLMYIKEDLILPHTITFQDLIGSKARGKSGPLFDFGVRDAVFVAADARLERDESHPGKVCERSWYDRNKHMHPASRWEMFDPNADYGAYTIRD